MRKRNNMIKVMLNDIELKHLEKQLEISGLTKSALLRKFIMNDKVNPSSVDCKKIYTLLSNATNNLNQIARQANTTGYVCGKKLDAALLLIRKCWQLLRASR